MLLLIRGPKQDHILDIKCILSLLALACRFDLEMEFKTLSKKVASARVGAKVKCEFIKEGRVE